VKPKLIAPEEAPFLENLATYLARSGATGRDEVFFFRKEDGTEVPLRSRTVRDQLKRTCESNGLPPSYFSSRSLRKGVITHMRATDRRDRGNYSAGSQVMNQMYDYAVGPLPRTVCQMRGGWDSET
jgi:hypothetical protein